MHVCQLEDGEGSSILRWLTKPEMIVLINKWSMHGIVSETIEDEAMS